MSKITVIESKKIEAPAAVVYNILADYNQHRQILPPNHFTHFQIEKGGVGAGTEFTVDITALGVTNRYRMVVTEPEPGAVLVESDTDTDLVTTFTVRPLSATQSEVTFQTTWQSKSGLSGMFEKLITPPVMRRMYRQELGILNEYAQHITSQ